MYIAVGSENRTKIKAVQTIFSTSEVKPMDVPSGVSRQPYSDAETRTGAINRAKECLSHAPAEIAIGLEGGVMYIENELYLCNWGALVTRENNVYTASGARIVLPADIAKELKVGKELGDIMDRYAKREAVRLNEGAIGIFTNDYVSRADMFTHVVALLRGQWEYCK